MARTTVTDYVTLTGQSAPVWVSAQSETLTYNHSGYRAQYGLYAEVEGKPQRLGTIRKDVHQPRTDEWVIFNRADSIVGYAPTLRRALAQGAPLALTQEA
jgi:hypothetical protein